jgi:uncharacterized RDD family membrane protein YckC
MNENLQYAGFWRRFAAYLIDGIVIAFALLQFRSFVYVQLVSLSTDMDTETLNAVVAAALGTMSLLFTWVYYSGMESSPLQATIGKLAVGIYVTDLQGQRISFGRATGRHFGKVLSGLILVIGYLMAGFTARKQALHDMLATCLVLSK